tara:strand:+ start:2203 stop:2427 length:225 start_codon:yes stop_codon:yes gene_type:complete
MVKKKSFGERFGARLRHARDRVNEQAKQKAEKKKEEDKKKPMKVHPSGAGGITAVRVAARPSVVGTNARGQTPK